jgi:hypothetical protein
MEKDLFEKQLGAETNVDIDFKDGDLVLTVTYDGKGLRAGVSVKVDGEYFLDKLAEKIPGNIDDAIIAMLKGALKA